ncbi:MAG: hypothetical protein NZM26_03895 [Patescibacteria group bacterium]|nr:hypothetical protein [Patescibacteria group bacterium]
MKVLILPGFSVKNKIWLEEAGKSLSKGKRNSCILHEWTHWRTGNKKDFSLKKEILGIKEKIKNQNNLFLLAKSIGTYVGANLIAQEQDVDFERMIFCGLPLNDLSVFAKEKFANCFFGISAKKILVVQNDLDPHGLYDQVKEFLNGANKDIKLVKMQADNHNYFYFDFFRAEFLKEGWL